MKDHACIDRRSLALAQAIVRKLDAGDVDRGLEKAREVNRRWRAIAPSALHDEWMVIMQGDWSDIKATLLDETERGCRLRQNNPFCGILTNRERWDIFREFRQDAA